MLYVAKLATDAETQNSALGATFEKESVMCFMALYKLQ